MQEINSEKKRLLDEVREYCDSKGMLSCTDIILGYSGGADSSLLLYVLRELCAERKIRLLAAHVNHMFRGEAADSDERFCAENAKKLGVPFRSLRTDVGAMARERAISDEQCAREVRYGFFEEIKKELCDGRADARVFVATAHNATDNAETVIFNMTRGTALTGLCGIPPVRDGFIVRPILFITKQRVLELCSALSVDYVTDSTNATTLYTRNRIRHNVLPSLREINPSLERSVARMTETIFLDLDYLEGEAERVYRSLLRDDGSLDADALSKCHAAIEKRALCMFFERSGAGYENIHIESCVSLLSGGGDFSLSLINKKRVRRERDLLTVEDDSREKPERTEYNIELSVGENILPSGGKIFVFTDRSRLDEIKTQNVYKLFIQQTISFDTINSTWYARSRRAGDSMRTGGHTHTVKKLFSDKKLGAEKRARIPIVERDGEMIWIPGVRVADSAFVGGERLYFAYAEE